MEGRLAEIKKWSIILNVNFPCGLRPKIARRKCIWGMGALVLAIVAFWLVHPNDLGLAGVHVLTSRRLEMKTLRTNTKTIADAFLTRRKAALMSEFNGEIDLAADYSKSSMIRSLGYRSSFYYYCWDIYLPYSIKSNSSKSGTVVVQLTDGVAGYGHDPKKFQVIRAILLDDMGRFIKQISGRNDGNKNASGVVNFGILPFP